MATDTEGGCSPGGFPPHLEGSPIIGCGCRDCGDVAVLVNDLAERLRIPYWGRLDHSAYGPVVTTQVDESVFVHEGPAGTVVELRYKKRPAKFVLLEAGQDLRKVLGGRLGGLFRNKSRNNRWSTGRRQMPFGCTARAGMSHEVREIVETARRCLVRILSELPEKDAHYARLYNLNGVKREVAALTAGISTSRGRRIDAGLRNALTPAIDRLLDALTPHRDHPPDREKIRWRDFMTYLVDHA